MELLTLLDIKSVYEHVMSRFFTKPTMSLEDFIRENYTPTYDKNLNFIGYETKSINVLQIYKEVK